MRSRMKRAKSYRSGRCHVLYSECVVLRVVCGCMARWLLRYAVRQDSYRLYKLTHEVLHYVAFRGTTLSFAPRPSVCPSVRPMPPIFLKHESRWKFSGSIFEV